MSELEKYVAHRPECIITREVLNRAVWENKCDCGLTSAINRKTWRKGTPRIKGRYLVTFFEEMILQASIAIDTFDPRNGGDGWTYENVLAWRPLPAPWSENEKSPS